MYISPKNSPVNRPAYELKAFQKVELAPGETKEIIIKLDQHDFCYYDVNSGFYTATSGEYEICIGNSVADIHLRNTISLAKDYKNIPHLYR